MGNVAYKTEQEEGAMTEAVDILGGLGINRDSLKSGDLKIHSPVDGELLGKVRQHKAREVDGIAAKGEAAFRNGAMCAGARRICEAAGRGAAPGER